MKLKTIKTLSEVCEALSQPQQMDRPPVELTEKDGSIRTVRIGGLQITGTYGLEVTKEVEFEDAKRYRVTAKVEGFTPSVTYYEMYSDAAAKRDSYGAGVDVTIDESVAVLLDNDGNVVSEVGGGAPVGTVSDDFTF